MDNSTEARLQEVENSKIEAESNRNMYLKSRISDLFFPLKPTTFVLIYLLHFVYYQATWYTDFFLYPLIVSSGKSTLEKWYKECDHEKAREDRKKVSIPRILRMQRAYDGLERIFREVGLFFFTSIYPEFGFTRESYWKLLYIIVLFYMAKWASSEENESLM